MKTWVKIMIIIVGVALLAAVGFILYSKTGHGIPGVDVMDGPDMVYKWPDYDLYGKWTEVDVAEGFKAGSIKIDKNTIVIDDGYGSKNKYKYKIPDNVEIEGRPEREVYLEIEGLKEYEDLIFHIEELDEGRLAVLSATVFEYDGRGEMILTEYVHEGDLFRVPSDFKSSLEQTRNRWDGVPPMIMNPNPMVVPETDPEEETANETDSETDSEPAVWQGPEDGGEEMNRPIQQAMPGGASTYNDSSAPKEVKSTDITYFSVNCSFTSLASPHKYSYVCAYAAKADAGTIVSLQYSAGSMGFQPSENRDVVALVSGDVMSELQGVVTEYNFVKSNGRSHYVNGLPGNFGGSVSIDYASGEYISFSDNQSPMLNPQAAEKIVDIISGYIEKNSIKPLNVNDITAVTYYEKNYEDDNNYTKEYLEGGKLRRESQYGKDGQFFQSEYDVPADTLEKIRKLADEKALLYYKGIKEMDSSVFKISNAKLIFTMKDGSEIEVTDCMKKPSQAGNIIFDVHMLFNELEQQKKE